MLEDERTCEVDCMPKRNEGQISDWREGQGDRQAVVAIRYNLLSQVVSRLVPLSDYEPRY